MADRVKVKRDGPRGWHWIARASFDPARHELVDDEPKHEPTEAPPVADKPRRGRPPKQR